MGKIRAHIVEKWPLASSAALSIVLLALHVYSYHPNPRLKNAMDATVVILAGDSQGSGFFVTRDGCALTANHVIRNVPSGKEIVFIIRGRPGVFKAKVVAADEYLDAAIVCADVVPPAIVDVVESESAETGDPVYAVGHPAGRTWNVTNGIVSRSAYKKHEVGSREIDVCVKFEVPRRGSREAAHCAQYKKMHLPGVWVPRWDLWVSNFISWGNSGGPVIDRYGRAVGMIVEWDDPGIDRPNNMNIAVPGTDLARFLRGVLGKYG